MTGALGWTVMASAVVIVLALVDCPAAVLAGTAFGIMGASLAWARFRQGRECTRPVVLGALPLWDDGEQDALDEGVPLEEFLGAIPVAWREEKFR